ncbi:hypothetical protein FQN49_007748 [Arthroderma sp. PD_2]|nr:hypothetical protein FQN49_007748 [Arthroderma sp. PD_2]
MATNRSVMKPTPRASRSIRQPVGFTPAISLDQATQRIGADTFQKKLESFFDSKRFSDLTIRTADKEHKVHKMVICGQSEVFSLMFDHDWKKSLENVIELKADHPRAIEAMISFMYKFCYDDTSDGLSPMLLHAKVYGAAHKYNVTPLQTYAGKRFENAVRSGWNTGDLPDAVTEVYTELPSTGCGLRKVLAECSRFHIQALLLKDDFKRLLENTAGFAADIIPLLVHRPAIPPTRCTTVQR